MTAIPPSQRSPAAAEHLENDLGADSVAIPALWQVQHDRQYCRPHDPGDVVPVSCGGNNQTIPNSKKTNHMKTPELKPSPLGTKASRALSDLSEKGVKEISASLQELLADVFALYVKTKNFHWHMTGPNFRDYHLLLDDHGDQIFEMTDVVAERIRKLGGVALRSIGDIARHQRLRDSDVFSLTPEAMLTELLADNQELIKYLRATHEVCDQHNDVATASLIENWIDETESRAWFLYETINRA